MQVSAEEGEKEERGERARESQQARMQAQTRLRDGDRLTEKSSQTRVRWRRISWKLHQWGRGETEQEQTGTQGRDR